VVGTVTRARHGLPSFNPTPISPLEVQMAESVWLQEGDPLVGPLDGLLVIQGTTSTTSSVAAIERVLQDDWSLMALRYNPFTGLVPLRVERKDASAADVKRVLMVRPTGFPTMVAHDGGAEVGLRVSAVTVNTIAAQRAHYYYHVPFRAPYGLWKKYANASASATATTGGATLTTVSDGVRHVAGQLEIGATTGSPTALGVILSGTTHLTITNPTTGQVADFGYTTAGDYSATTATVVPGGRFRVPAGSTAWTVQVTGGTGTVAVTARFYPEYGSW